MEQEDNRIFSETLKTNRRTYFFDVKKTKEDSSYLIITENRNGRKDKIMIFEEYSKDFLEHLEKAITFMQQP